MKQKSIALFILLFLTIHVLFAESDTTQTKRVRFTGIPTIGYNQSYGLQLGAIGMMLFKVNQEDTISPPSSLNVIGYITTNKSWFGIAFQRLYFNQDNWRILWGLGLGDNNFQFYTEDLPDMGGVYIDFTTSTFFGFASVSRRVYDKFYMGLMVGANKLNTEYYLENLVGFNPDSLKQLVGWGIPLAYDTRDNQFNPSEGFNINLRTNFNQKWLGSDLDFSNLTFEFNYYKQITTRGLLASRATMYTGLGDVPFEGQRVVGRGDIRGYTKGKYRGDQLYTAQVEYRHSFPKRFGFVAFFGLAGVVNNLSEDNKWSGLLPGGGVGIRFLAIKEHKINIGIDAAVGKGDQGIYFRLGEAF
jgi:outer membrane protein assembly factor BamA